MLDIFLITLLFIYSSLNESICSVIDIPDSTPDVSCELSTSKGAADGCLVSTSSATVPNEHATMNFQHRLGAPARHSDIYITDVYNVNDHSIETESAIAETPEPVKTVTLETVDEVADTSQQDSQAHDKTLHDDVVLFPNVREFDRNLLELTAGKVASAPSVPIAASTITAEGETSKTNSRSYVRMCVQVKCTIMRTKAADGGTINELVSVRCDDCAVQSGGDTSGVHADLSSTGSSDLIHQTFPPPPPPPTGSSILSQRYKSRFSHASSTSSTSASSIASSASALAARMNIPAVVEAVAITEREKQIKTLSTETTSENDSISLSNERISELRDKWMNSREVWRLLDHIDRMMDKNGSVILDSDIQYLTRRGRKTKQPDNDCQKPDEQSECPMTPRPAKRRKATNQASCDASVYCVGSRVFAKWTDRRFYAATLVESISDGRWLVEFYDGNRRPVSEEHMLYVDNVAIIGQKVFARAQSPSESGVGDDFQAGIVTGCESDESNERLMFTVARNDSDITVPSEYILLTEHQVRQIKKKPTSNGDHCSSPLPSSAAYRSTRSKTRCVTNRVDSPVPGSSGTQRRRNRNAASNGQTTTRQRGRGRPKRQNADSTVGQRNVTSTSDETRDDVDYEDYDDDDDSYTTNSTSNRIESNIGYGNAANVSGLEPEAAASYDASGRIKGKTVDGKATRFGREPREEETAALGPMPASGTQPFKGLHVLLSCASEITLSTAGTRICGIDGESDYGGDGKSSCTSGDFDFKFSNHPFVKARLRAQLIAGGAIMHDSLEDVPSQKLGQTYLIANRPSRTAAYVACMAAGVRICCHDWVIRCCAEGKFLSPQELPYGWSIEKERYFMSYERQGPQGSGCAALKRRVILISDGGDAHFTSYWTHVLKLSGATVKSLSLCDDNEVSRAFCVLCDCGHKDDHAVRAHRRGAKLVTTTWLVQTLIHGEVRKFDATSSYRPDYVDHSD